jgi:hypothetical protein
LSGKRQKRLSKKMNMRVVIQHRCEPSAATSLNA